MGRRKKKPLIGHTVNSQKSVLERCIWVLRTTLQAAEATGSDEVSRMASAKLESFEWLRDERLERTSQTQRRIRSTQALYSAVLALADGDDLDPITRFARRDLEFIRILCAEYQPKAGRNEVDLMEVLNAFPEPDGVSRETE